MHCTGTSKLSVDKASQRKRQILGQILRGSKPGVQGLHKVLCQSTLFQSPGKKYGLISFVRKCSRLWIVEERRGSKNQSYHFVSCPRHKLYAEDIRRGGAVHHSQYAFHGSAHQPKIATNTTQSFHSYFAALLKVTKPIKLLRVFCNTMVESARSREKRKTFSICNDFWVTGLIIDSFHFLMEKSIHFINLARLEAAQLVNQITVFPKNKASYRLSSSYNVKGVNR